MIVWNNLGVRKTELGDPGPSKQCLKSIFTQIPKANSLLEKKKVTSYTILIFNAAKQEKLLVGDVRLFCQIRFNGSYCIVSDTW